MSRRPAILDELPPDVRVEEGPRSFLAVRSSAAEALGRAGFDGSGGEVTQVAGESGRRPLREIRQDDARFLVRRLHHGGLLRWVTGDRYADPARPFQELLVSQRLTEAGIPTPEVVAARAIRARGPLGPVGRVGWYLDVVTRRVDGAQDGGVWLERLRRGDLDRVQRATILRALGTLVGELHRLGLDHPDLQQRNLLVRAPAAGERSPAVWVLDLDRAALRTPLPEENQVAQLERFLRAVLRQEAGGRACLAATDFARFLAAWRAARGPSGTDPDSASSARADRRRMVRAVLALQRRTRGSHAASGALERVFGASPAERDRRSPDAGDA